MDELISQYIDNELDLDEKIEFVQQVKQQEGYAEEAVDLLTQEKLLCVDFAPSAADFKPSFGQRLQQFWRVGYQPLLAASLLILVWAVFPLQHEPQEQQFESTISHRFVLFQPGVESVEITGSLTNWQAVPLQKIGESGYWEVTLNIPNQEHRYAYILDQVKTIADPTQLLREKDEFGSMNSILEVGAS